jgi:nucleotide-binding universal stress UspA family protein
VRVRRILVPLDFSKGSEAALGYARLFAAVFGAEVALLHVVDARMPFREATGPPLAAAWEPGHAARVASGRLDQLARAMAREGPWPKTAVRLGTEYEQILAASREPGIDLIVMGTHGRTGLGRVLLGSVAEQVVRRAPCPVLTVPQGEKALSDF